MVRSSRTLGMDRENRGKYDAIYWKIMESCHDTNDFQWVGRFPNPTFGSFHVNISTASSSVRGRIVGLVFVLFRGTWFASPLWDPWGGRCYKIYAHPTIMNDIPHHGWMITNTHTSLLIYIMDLWLWPCGTCIEIHSVIKYQWEVPSFHPVLRLPQFSSHHLVSGPHCWILRKYRRP